MNSREDYQIQYEKMREDMRCQINKAKEEMYYEKTKQERQHQDDNLPLGLFFLKYGSILGLLAYTYMKLI